MTITQSGVKKWSVPMTRYGHSVTIYEWWIWLTCWPYNLLLGLWRTDGEGWVHIWVVGLVWAIHCNSQDSWESRQGYLEFLSLKWHHDTLRDIYPHCVCVCVLVCIYLGWDTALFTIQWKFPKLSSISERQYSQLRGALKRHRKSLNSSPYVSFLCVEVCLVLIYNDCLLLEVNFTDGQALVDQLEVAIRPWRPLATLLVLLAAHDAAVIINPN